MDEGRFIATGRPLDLVREHVGEFVLELLGDAGVEADVTREFPALAIAAERPAPVPLRRPRRRPGSAGRSVRQPRRPSSARVGRRRVPQADRPGDPRVSAAPTPEAVRVRSRRGLAAVSARFTKVWYRDTYVYASNWKTNLLPPLIEPFIYLFAMGIGVGYYIDHDRRGRLPGLRRPGHHRHHRHPACHLRVHLRLLLPHGLPEHLRRHHLHAGQRRRGEPGRRLLGRHAQLHQRGGRGGASWPPSAACRWCGSRPSSRCSSSRG